MQFLSTLSLRRATHTKPAGQAQGLISIHALLAESDLAGPSGPAFLYNFYPRSPCGERPHRPERRRQRGDFYPRSPCGERHAKRFSTLHHILISIHALLAESDDASKDAIKAIANFYPRSPCGERRYGFGGDNSLPLFLSTLSLRRATNCRFHARTGRAISIHALLAESDPQ